MNGVDERLDSPAAARNLPPIQAVLADVLPASGLVLELASGPGQHVVAFAEAFPELTFQPSDPDPLARRSIEAWIRQTGARNVLPPLDLDVSKPDWETALACEVRGAVAINLLHIAPWVVTEGLFRGVAGLLEVGAPLVVYGPFKRDGRHTSPSNRAFDRMLRAQDPMFGVRDLDEVGKLAQRHGLTLDRTVAMPANNLSLVYRRAPGETPA